MDNQDNLLYNYGFFAEQSLTEDRQADFRKLIDAKEPSIKTRIENFKESCISSLRKGQLNSMLKSYELYLIAKQSLFKESQQRGFNWIRDNIPIDPDFYKPKD